jgi:hypothetical protein
VGQLASLGPTTLTPFSRNSARELWWLNIWSCLAVIPLYCVACNGTAFDGCSLAGLWKPEQRPRRPPAAAAGAGGHGRQSHSDAAQYVLKYSTVFSLKN